MKWYLVVLLGLSMIFLASCSGILVTSAPATPTATMMSLLPLRTPLPSSTPAPLPTPASKTLTVCAGNEPAELYLFNELSYTKKVILSAIYDGPIDVSGYGYQPVILEKLPSLADGDAVIETVTVQANDPVVDAFGLQTILQPGVIVRPAGCRASGCAVTYVDGTVTMDRMRVTFHLKKGLLWSDGSPLIATDSIYGYTVARDESTLFANNGLTSGSAQSVSYTAAYTAPDTHTTEWIGLPGFLDPNYQLNFFHPLPEHQLQGYSIPQISEANEVLYSPMGWGPFRVTGWDQGKQITLASNPNYSRAGEGLPYYTTLVVRFVGQDYEQNDRDLRNGTCDVLLQDAVPATPSSAVRSLVDDGAAKLYLDPQPVFEHLTFNFIPAGAVTPAYFTSLPVRQAVALCIDRTMLANRIFAGALPPLEYALPSGHPLLAGLTLSQFPYDPATAKTLLQSAGWVDANADGLLESRNVPGVADGQPLILKLVTSDAADRTETASLIALQLEKCGIQVDLEQAPARDLLAQNEEALLSGRRFDLAFTSSPMGVESMCNLAESDLVSSAANGWSGSNLGGYSNPDFDAACAAVRSTLPGTPEYVTSRQAALKIFTDDLPVFPLFYDSHYSLVRSNLAGFTVGFGQASELQNVESFHPGP